MASRSFRNRIFSWHRYIGLAVGIVLAIVGLTGSILVFHHEIDHAMLEQKIGSITPQGERISIAQAIETVETTYRDRPEFKDFKISGVDAVPGNPYEVSLTLPEEKPAPRVFVNPYTGEIMGDRTWDGSFFDYNNEASVDQYSGKVLLVKNSQSLALADRILNSFTPVHYGTFGGLPTRILYIFVGLSPTILLGTGFIMWRLRKKDKPKRPLPELVHHS